MISDLCRTVLAAIRSLAAYVGVSVYVLAVAPPGMAIALWFRRPEVLYWLGRGGVRLGLAAAGIHYRVEGREHLQAGRATVYCVNHGSNLEPPIVYMALASVHPRLKILYKSELRQVIPVLRSAFDVVGFVPIDRHSRENSTQSIESAAKSLKAGNSFLVFPEGTRSRTGELLPFKKGGFVMAIRAGAAVVPVSIQGTRAAMRKGSPIIRPVTVSVRIGLPLDGAGASVDQRDALIAKTRGAMQALLAQGPIMRQ